MTAPLRLTPRKGDLLAAALILALAIGLLLALHVHAQTSPPPHVEIYQNGELIQKASLDLDQNITVSGKYINTITIRDGKIAITHSTCPGTDCVHSGWAGSSGQAIICLPNKTEVRLVGTPSSGSVDAIAG